MRYVVSKTKKKVTVTRRGRKKKDEPMSSNALPITDCEQQMEAICDGNLNAQLSSVSIFFPIQGAFL